MAQLKAEMVETVRKLVRESLELRLAGGTTTRTVRAQGYADGYMRLLLDSDVVTQQELLALVMSERARLNGPPTAVLAVEALA